MEYLYGEDIQYEYDLIKPEDYELLQAFSCGNEQLDYFIHNELLKNGEINTEDGLPFKFWNAKTNELYAIVSLATSGIIFKVDNFTQVLPAIKIDTIAVDLKYQKLHMDEESKQSDITDEHRYFSDAIMIKVILHCRKIAEEMATARYIVLYADKKAKRYYERNLFNDFVEFMEKENNMVINKNIPMYMEL